MGEACFLLGTISLRSHTLQEWRRREGTSGQVSDTEAQDPRGRAGCLHGAQLGEGHPCMARCVTAVGPWAGPPTPPHPWRGASVGCRGLVPQHRGVDQSGGWRLREKGTDRGCRRRHRPGGRPQAGGRSPPPPLRPRRERGGAAQGARGGAVFTFRRPLHVAGERRAPIGGGGRRPRPGVGGLRSAGRVGPPAEPLTPSAAAAPGGARTRGLMQRIGMAVSGDGAGERGLGQRAALPAGRQRWQPSCRHCPPLSRSAFAKGAGAGGTCGAGRGVGGCPGLRRGAAGPGAAPRRRGGAGASGARALAEGGRRAGELSAALAHAQRGPGPRYIATWRRRQLSSAARAAAAEVRGGCGKGVPPVGTGGGGDDDDDGGGGGGR